MAKIELRGPGPLVVNFIVNYCCTGILFLAKMIKKPETEETRLFCHIFIISWFLIGGGRQAPWLRLWLWSEVDKVVEKST